MDGSYTGLLQSGCCFVEHRIFSAFLIEYSLGFLAEFCCSLLRVGCENHLFRFYIAVGDMIGQQMGKCVCLSTTGACTDICYSFHMKYLFLKTFIITEYIGLFHSISYTKWHEVLICSITYILQSVCWLTFPKFNSSFLNLTKTVCV